MKKLALAALFALSVGPTQAAEVGCVDTAFKLIGPNHKVCVESFRDTLLPGVACHLSRARTGGVSGWVGLAEDPSRFSIACRQVGPITIPANMPESERVFDERTSLLFKGNHVVRMWDPENNSIVYLVYSTKLIDGSPMNSVSTVPVMPWPEK